MEFLLSAMQYARQAGSKSKQGEQDRKVLYSEQLIAILIKNSKCNEKV